MRLMLEECGLLPQHAVLVGLSGGVDSVVLLHALCSLRERGRISAVMAAHLHHGLRGADADADAAFCAALCREWDVPFACGRVDVGAVAARRGLSLEMAAREERYAFLRDTAVRLGADCIAVAHHMDDQAETLLLHLLRGSGLAGLAGMRPRMGTLVRPLLGVRRSEIEAYAQAHGLAFRTDATNASDAMTRNRIRHELLPLLGSFNPQIVERLCATAALLAQDEDCLDGMAQAAAGAEAGRGEADREALLALHGAVRSRVLKRFLLQAQGGEVERRDVERLETLLEARTGTQIELRGGAAAWVDSQRLHVGRPPQQMAFAVPFAAPGRTRTPRGTFFATEDGTARPGSIYEACIDFDALPEHVVVRTRRTGDRFHPLGAPGGRKLSDVMTDRKLPRWERDVPLLCSGGQVLWMPGYTIAEPLKITPQTRRILHIIFEEDTGNDGGQAHGTGHSGNPFG